MLLPRGGRRTQLSGAVGRGGRGPAEELKERVAESAKVVLEQPLARVRVGVGVGLGFGFGLGLGFGLNTCCCSTDSERMHTSASERSASLRQRAVPFERVITQLESATAAADDSSERP